MRSRTSRLAVVIGSAIAIGGCSGGGAGEGGGVAPVVYDFYVDAGTGDDTNPGTETAPFKTITKAVQTAIDGKSIKVAPGIYDAANGESFPILVPAGVILIGDEPNKGTGTVWTEVFGGGTGDAPTSTILPASYSVIAGFAITNPGTLATDMGIVLFSTEGVTLRNNTIYGNNGAGVWVAYSVNHVISGNVIYNNATAGLIFATNGGTGSRVENNEITDNQSGVKVNVTGIDLGGGGAGSVGGNRIYANLTNDLYTATDGITIYARNCYWDNDGSPTVGTGNTDDIYNAGTATIHTDGSQKVPPL